MRKLIIGLMIILLPVVALAEIDWSGMTVEQIQEEISKGQKELLTRNDKSKEDDNVIIDEEGFVVVINDINISPSGSSIDIYYTMTNDGTREVAFMTDKCYVNGWELGTLFGNSLEPGRKLKEKDSIHKIKENTDITNFDEDIKVELTLDCFECENYTSIKKNINLVFYVNKNGWHK